MIQKVPMKRPHLLTKLFSDPEYRGKHVVVVGGKVFTATTGAKAAKIFEEQVKRHPTQRPLTTYIPADNTLIL